MATQQKTATAKIVPQLWFDRDAVAAAKFYTSLLPDSHVDSISDLPADSPSGPAGSVEIVEFTLFDHPFSAFNAGPVFRPNPSISFMINFDPLLFGGHADEARMMLDRVWNQLAAAGKTLMPLDRYPFSDRYGWVQDRYGLSWQLILTNPEGEPRPAIMPSLLFSDEHAGQAEDAIRFYLSVFKNSKLGTINRYRAGQPPDKEGTVAFADFMLEHQWFGAMDSAREHGYTFNEAISLMVNCEDQKELDYYWDKLSAVPESEQCGWLKDRYGVSWQIVPTVFDEMRKDPDRERARSATEAMLRMKKLDIKGLERAFAGKR